jgi:hypothetical protein
VRRGRFSVENGASDAAAVLEAISSSERWKGVHIHGRPNGIVVDRKGDPAAWLCDLWLAERLADALSTGDEGPTRGVSPVGLPAPVLPMSRAVYP